MIGLGNAFGLDRPQVLLSLIPLFLFACLRLIRSTGFVRSTGSVRDRSYASLTAPLALRWRLSRFFFWLFAASLLFALAGPHWGTRQVIEYHRGLDVIFALDMSRSMEVRDAPQLALTPLAPTPLASRLERAVALSREMAAEAGGIRFGAAFGRGRAILAVPLTEDSTVTVSFLDSLGEAVYTGTGTNLESLIDAAASGFLDNLPSRRVIVLLSDGEALSGSLVRAVERAKEGDIRIAAVGLGTAEGGPVPGTYGESPQSRLQREALEEAAGRSGGIYLDGNNPGAASALRSYLDSQAQESGITGRRSEPRPRWRFFLIIALASLGLSTWLMRRTRKRPVLAVLLVALIFPSCSPVSGKLLVVEGNFYHSQGRYDEAIQAYSKALAYPEILPYAEYALGTVYTSLEEMAPALSRYDAASRAIEDLPLEGREELTYRINYNRGVVLFWEGNFEEAAGAFKEALKIDGSRIEAKRNLELALLSLSQQRQAPAVGEGEEGEGRLSALFQYLNQKEQNQWKSREWEEAPSAGPDY